ncbi:MAG: helix-hairpin-helix domain-containing protein [Candidatus Peribacteraceae bacterium]|nr:helix-hairpin-helix domain-containing protein [Candidatus Peribacteraceae bacterium]
MPSEFEKIPGVGKKVARYIQEIGLKDFADLSKADPEKMYTQFCVLRGIKIDRCLLYVFRSAVAFARQPHDKPWWKFKD